MAETECEYDVIIIGGGPVGVGLAIDLAIHGHRSIIVERHKTIQRIPKGQNLTPRTGEHFRRWGVTDAIRAAAPIPRSYGSGGMATYGSFLSDYHYEWFNRAKIINYYAATNERLPQYKTEAVLRARAAADDHITLLMGWSFAALTQNEDGVTVTIAETKGTGQRTLTARYLVGCDGARSPVRTAAGITQTVDPHDRLMALLVFHSQQLDEKLSIYGEKAIFNAINPELKGYWQFLGRVDLDCNWFFHAPVPPGTTRDNFDFRTFLEKAVGAPIDIAFEYVGFWELRLSLADSYGTGRVFIAGDAAHSHPPYGGYGVNTGFEDARNLSWKLSACLDGWGGAQLLDSYSAERHPVFASTRDDFIVRSIIHDRSFTEAFDPRGDLAAFEDAWARRAAGDEADLGAARGLTEDRPVVERRVERHALGAPLADELLELDARRAVLAAAEEPGLDDVRQLRLAYGASRFAPRGADTRAPRAAPMSPFTSCRPWNQPMPRPGRPQPVSYTHLTLPTKA